MQDGDNPIASGAASAKPVTPNTGSNPTMAEIAAAGRGTNFKFNASEIGFKKAAQAPTSASEPKPMPAAPTQALADAPAQPEQAMVNEAKLVVEPDAAAPAPAPELEPAAQLEQAESFGGVYPDSAAQETPQDLPELSENAKPIETSSFSYPENEPSDDGIVFKDVDANSDDDLSEPLENNLLEDLPEGATIITAPAEPAAPAPMTPATAKEAPKSKSKTGLIVGIIVVLVLAGGAAAFFALGKNNTVAANTETIEEQQEEEVAEKPKAKRLRNLADEEKKEKEEEKAESEDGEEETEQQEAAEEDTAKYIELKAANVKVRIPDDENFFDYRVVGNKVYLWAATAKTNESAAEEGVEGSEESEESEIPAFADRSENINGMAVLRWDPVMDSDAGTQVFYKEKIDTKLSYYFSYKGSEVKFSGEDFEQGIWETDSGMYLSDWFHDASHYVDLDAVEIEQ